MTLALSHVTGEVHDHALCLLVKIEHQISVHYCKTHDRWMVVLHNDECPQDLYDAATSAVPEGSPLCDWGQVDNSDYLAFGEAVMERVDVECEPLS